MLFPHDGHIQLFAELLFPILLANVLFIGLVGNFGTRPVFDIIPFCGGCSIRLSILAGFIPGIPAIVSGLRLPQLHIFINEELVFPHFVHLQESLLPKAGVFPPIFGPLTGGLLTIGPPIGELPPIGGDIPILEEAPIGVLTPIEEVAWNLS